MQKKITISALFILVLIFLVPVFGFAKDKKDPKLDALVAEFKAAKSNNDKANKGRVLAQYCYDVNNSQCESYANEAIKAAKAAKMEKTVAELYCIVGSYYFKNKNYKKAASLLESEYSIRKKFQQARPRLITCYNLGFCYYKLNSPKKAKKYYDEAMVLAKKLGNKAMIDRLTRSLSEVSVQQKNYKDAYEYLNKYLKSENKRFQEEYALLQDIADQQEQEIQHKDTIIQEVISQNELLDAQKAALEANKKQLEAENQLQAQEILNKELENKTLSQEKEIRELYIKWFVCAFLAVAIALFFIIRSSIIRKRTAKQLQEKNDLIESKNKAISQQNEEIKAKNDELKESYKVIELKNKDITDSLTYAGKIQKAMLRDFANYSKLMSDYFIFYAPKDIVSGDFYWAHKVDDKFVFTVGDCTGHSVPGAFMSMLGIALLNQIVAQQRETQASKILEQMRSLVKLYLGQTGINEEPKDGMDMSLCVWDLKTNQANYSGAYNPLWQIRNGELTSLDAVKCPVGVHNRELPFEDKYFEIQKGDRYYMFSDGYSDQFGEKNHEKFKTVRFKKLLLESSTLTMSQQHDLVTKNYYDWKGNFVQIDDVCVLGIEI